MQQQTYFCKVKEDSCVYQNFPNVDTPANVRLQTPSRRMATPCRAHTTAHASLGLQAPPPRRPRPPLRDLTPPRWAPTLGKPCRLSCWSSNMVGYFLPQDLCTCCAVCRESFSLRAGLSLNSTLFVSASTTLPLESFPLIGRPFSDLDPGPAHSRTQQIVIKQRHKASTVTFSRPHMEISCCPVPRLLHSHSAHSLLPPQREPVPGHPTL